MPWSRLKLIFKNSLDDNHFAIYCSSTDTLCAHELGVCYKLQTDELEIAKKRLAAAVQWQGTVGTYDLQLLSRSHEAFCCETALRLTVEP